MEPTQLGSRARIVLRGGKLTNPKTGRSIAIKDKPLTIGRGESCDVRLEDRHVSLLHCEVSPSDQGVVVRDHGSTNGTWINDVQLGSGQHAYLGADMILRVGDTRLRFTPNKDGEERDLPSRFGPIESQAPAMQRVLSNLHKIARTDIAVHITGETGTGKGYLARAIHAQSARASKPFVVIDCSAIPPNLAEAELFGHEAGAYTGAAKRKESPFVEADGGTVFLDEIGDLPLEVQPKLLRVIDEQEVKPVGSNCYQKIDVRILSASLHNLSERVNAKQFRDDLFMRLRGASIELPPLRHRPEDLEPLVRTILADLRCPEAFATIGQETLVWMRGRDWRGNVRQLRHVVKLAVDFARGGPLDIEGAFALNSGDGEAARRLRTDQSAEEIAYGVLTVRGTSVEAVTMEATRVLFERLVRETGVGRGSLDRLCERAGVSKPFLRERLQELGLRRIPPAFGSTQPPPSSRRPKRKRTGS